MVGNIIDKNILIELGTIVLEVILIVLYNYRVDIKPQRPIGRIVICFIMFVIPLALLSLFPQIPVFRIIYSFVGIAILYRYCYNLDIPNSIYMTAFFLMLSIASDIVCSYCVKLIGIANNGISGNALNRMAYNGISKIIHLILIQTAPYLIKRKQPHISLVGAIPLLTAQLASLLICMCLYFSGSRSGNIGFETVAGVIATLYINLVICFYVEAVSAKNDLAKEKELAEREYQYKLKYYESVKQSQEETRSLWHEIQKYLNLIHTLVNGGENQEAVRCMAEVTTIFNGITVNVDVGNSIISGILSVGLQQAKQKNIPFNIDAWVASDLGIEPQDLLIILGNAIDNAIEECAQIFPERDRYINVLIHQKEKILVIKVENPCRSTPTPKPGKIHGYGLKNVKRCVDKYNGELQVKSQNGEFCFFVLLNIQQ